MAIEPITLAGSAVRLEPLSLDHVDALAAAGAGSRDTYEWTWVPDGPDEARSFIETALAEFAAGRSLPFATIRLADNRVVGSTRFGNIEHWSWPDGSPHGGRTVDAAEVGWTWLAADAQRSPVNTEAKYLMFSHGFDTWGLHRLQLKTDERNWRSRNAIERVGARFEGILRAWQPGRDGAIRNTAMFSITADEWPSAKAALEAKLNAYGK